MPTYLVDTNFFFECRAAADLPWHELEGVEAGQAADVDLVVPSPVVLEIERHKTKGGGRTAKRARTVSATLRSAYQSGDMSVVVRNASPKVTISMPPPVRSDFATFPNLDPAKPDHQIVAEYVALLPTYPSLIILTDDTLLALTASYIGYRPQLVPDSWKTPPENDERDSEIVRLKDEIRSLKQNTPVLSIAILRDGAEVEGINKRISVFKIDRPSMRECLDIIKRRHPLKTDFNASKSRAGNWNIGSFSGTWYPPSEADIERYEREYATWAASLETWLTGLVEYTNENGRNAVFKVAIANSGFVNGQDVRMSVAGFDGIRLLGPLTKRDQEHFTRRTTVPASPKAPAGSFIEHSLFQQPSDAFSKVFPAPLVAHAPDRDPMRFYISGERPTIPVEELGLTCRAVPHQSDPVVTNLRAIIAPNELGRSPRMRIRIKASNLRNPVERIINVGVTSEDLDLVGLVERLCRTGESVTPE